MDLSTKELSDANKKFFRLNQWLNAVMNSLTSGLLLISPEGVCQNIYSKSCTDLLEVEDPEGKHILDVLKIKEEDKSTYEEWLRIMFSGTVDFDDAVGLGPSVFDHSDITRRITLDYRLVPNEDGTFLGLLLVARDETDIFQAKAKAEEAEQQSNMILKLSSNKLQVFFFTKEVKSFVEKYGKGNNEKIDIDDVKRAIHTIKGAASFLYIKDFIVSSQDMEHKLVKLINSETDRADIFEVIREFAQHYEQQLDSLFSKYGKIIGKSDQDSNVRQYTTKCVTEFHERLSKMKDGKIFSDLFYAEFLLEPIETLFTHFDDVLRDTALNLGKEVKPLEIYGAKFDVNPIKCEDFISQLINLFRNCITHGVETPEDRQKVGKDAEGLIEVAFSKGKIEAKDAVVIEISDDGKGINPEIVKNKLESLGYDTKGKSYKELIQHVLDPNFSTNKAVSVYAGRGMGMSAVKESVTELNGEIEVTSELNKYTKFIITIPLENIS